MRAALDTDHVISGLVADARAHPGAGRIGLAPALLLAALLSLLVAGAAVSAVYGPRPDLAAKFEDVTIVLKGLAVLALAIGGYLVALRAGSPDSRGLALPALLPGGLLLLAGALLDHSGLTIIGRMPTSPVLCVSAILLVSILPLGFILLALRQGAPTRLRQAGAAAGLLAGSLGATAYTIACKVDSGLFVAVWYAVAILIVAGIGAAIGRRALAW